MYRKPQMDVISHRIELLKLEGLGFSQPEIVLQLSQKANCSKRTIYQDFETRTEWQPTLQAIKKMRRHTLKSSEPLRANLPPSQRFTVNLR